MKSLCILLIFFYQGSCSWYQSKQCKPCTCYAIGSTSLDCRQGRCSCKPGFAGPKCNDKDCVMSSWRWDSQCQCGPGKTRSRSRHVVEHPHGKGKRCGINTKTVPCNKKCQCAQHEFGPFCENRHCAVGQWKYPTGHICLQKQESCSPRYQIKKHTSYIIEREITIQPKGSGKKCPKLRKYKYCTYIDCRDDEGPSWWG